MKPLNNEAEQYVRTVLNLFQQLPETPPLPSSRDRLYAHTLQQRGLPLTLIETAFLLGSLRRLSRGRTSRRNSGSTWPPAAPWGRGPGSRRGWPSGRGGIPCRRRGAAAPAG